MSNEKTRTDAAVAMADVLVADRAIIRPSRHRGRKAGPRRGVLPWLFLAPAMIAFALFKFWPMARGIYLSFFQVRPYLGNTWVGGANFSQALNDVALRWAVLHTIVDAVGVVVGSMLVGFGLALLLEGPARHLRIVRTAVFLPVVSAMVVVAEIWNTLLYPAGYGVANRLIALVGVGPLAFLSSTHQSLASLMMIQIWKQAPYDMLLFLAGLAAVDRQLYEAAAIDGAGAWQRLRYITIPSLRHVTTIVITLGIIRGLRVFTEVYVLTGGGPAGSTETIMTYTYRTGISSNNLGYASAISTLLFAVTLVLTGVNLWWRRRREAA